MRFWQRGGGFDRNLFSSGELWEKIRYVHENPVKRGLCAKRSDWPWSSAADYAGARAGPLKIDWESIPEGV
jgi:putative transposase